MGNSSAFLSRGCKRTVRKDVGVSIGLGGVGQVVISRCQRWDPWMLPWDQAESIMRSRPSYQQVLPGSSRVSPRSSTVPRLAKTSSRPWPQHETVSTMTLSGTPSRCIVVVAVWEILRNKKNATQSGGGKGKTQKRNPVSSISASRRQYHLRPVNAPFALLTYGPSLPGRYCPQRHTLSGSYPRTAGCRALLRTSP